MKLLLNLNLWNPLPERWDDQIIKKYLKECGMTPEEEKEAEEESSDDEEVMTAFSV